MSCRCKEHIKKKCFFCKKVFYCCRYRMNSAKFCSLSCRAKNHSKIMKETYLGNRIEIVCGHCGEKFMVKKSRKNTAKYCSRKCEGIELGEKRGEETHNWKGGTPNCMDCGKKLTSKNSKRCMKCSVKVRIKTGINKPKCIICGKKLSNYNGKYCRKHFSSSIEYKNGCKRGGIRGAMTTSLKNETGIEKKVYEELKNRGLLFEKQYLVNERFLVDAWIPSLNLIIEADGKYWHDMDKIKKKDKAENAYLTKCGFNLLRLTEEEINNGTFKERMVI